MQSRNVFAGPYLERAAHLRSDPAWFDNALADPRSRVVPVWNSRSLVADGDTPGAATPRAAFLDMTQIPLERHNVNDLILLGHFNGTNYFAYEIESAEPPAAPSGTRYEDLRLLAAVLPPEDSGLLGYARAMVTWRRRHRY
jgi:NAD+ diphosphatase